MAAASVESCQFVVLRCPLGSPRVGTIHTRNRLRRMRRRFKHFLANALSAPAQTLKHQVRQGFRFQSPSRALPRRRRMRRRRLPDPRPIPEGVREPISPRKKVCNLDPMAPRSRQKRQLPEGPPVVAVAVSSDPILPQR